MTKAAEGSNLSLSEKQWQDCDDQPPDVARIVTLVRKNAGSGDSLVLPLQRAAHAIFDVDRPILARSELFEKLKQLQHACANVSRLVLDPAIQGIERDIHETFGVPEGLDVPGAMARLSGIVDKHIKRLSPRAGQPRMQRLAGLYGIPKARLLCAAVICEAWRRQRGRTPNRRTERAQGACAELWRVAGGTVADKSGRGTDSADSSWERHLKDAKTIAASELEAD